MTTTARPFSNAWCLVSVVLFLTVEWFIGVMVGPKVVGVYVSQPFHLQLQMMMHLVAFFLGGFGVGLLSPGVRLKEPAVGAAISVAASFTLAFFVPHAWFIFSWSRLLLGGAIAVGLAVAGAYSGERFMGNIDPDGNDVSLTAKGRLRASLWNRATGLFVTRSDG